MKPTTAFASLLSIAALSSAPARAAQLSDVEHIIVIYLENHGFDNMFGAFPGADGLAAAGVTKVQVDKAGRPYEFLPPVINTSDPPHIDSRFPLNLPNQPFSIEAFVPINKKVGDLVHRFYEQQLQIDGGRMDKFVAYSNAGGLTMGFYATAAKPICGDGPASLHWPIISSMLLSEARF